MDAATNSVLLSRQIYGGIGITLKFKQSLNLRKFDVKSYTKSRERAIGQVFRESIREWLREVILNVPVKTGHARGSLQPLGTFLRVAVPIRPKPGQPDKSLLGNNQQKFKIKDDRSNPGEQVFTFTWSSDVLHYYLNEFGFVHGPWNSVLAGEEAFFAYFRSNVQRRLPSVFKHIKRQRIARG